MNVSYKGAAEFTPAQKKKLDARFSKLAKLLGKDGDKEAHVVLTAQRHLQRAEITVNYHGHPLVGLESASDQLTAILSAVEKLEKQMLKVRTKFRDTRRTPDAKAWSIPQQEEKKKVSAKSAGAKSSDKAAKAVKPAPKQKAAAPASGRVFRVNGGKGRKPMTLDEAMLEIGPADSHLSYRDADTDRVHVLVRRPDGHFDLIES